MKEGGHFEPSLGEVFDIGASRVLVVNPLPMRELLW